MVVFVLEDDLHAEPQGEYASFEDALAELRRRSRIPWDRPSNVAPCTSWRTCERHYVVVEVDDSRLPWREPSRVSVLRVSSSGVRWSDGFEDREGAEWVT